MAVHTVLPVSSVSLSVLNDIEDTQLYPVTNYKICTAIGLRLISIRFSF